MLLTRKAWARARRELVVEGADFELEAGEKFGLEEMSELQEARESDMLRRVGWRGRNLF